MKSMDNKTEYNDVIYKVNWDNINTFEDLKDLMKFFHTERDTQHGMINDIFF